MHQHPRPPPRMASPATSPTTNPHRTNNPREESQTTEGSRSRATSEVMAYNESGGVSSAGVGEQNASGPSRDAIKKLDQIIQVGYPRIPNHHLV